MFIRFSKPGAALLAFLLLSAASFAETLVTDQYRLKINPKAKITERVDTGWEVMMTVDLDGERARVRWTPEGFTAIYPNGTLKAKLAPSASRTAYQLTTDFEGQRYIVTKSPKEVAWKLPGQDVFFRTFGGKVSNVVGTSDYLNITRDTKGGRISLESQAGTSDVLLKKGKLEVFEGPETVAHLYFVRGLAFHRGPLTLEIPLPDEPFLNALPGDRYMKVESKQAAPAVPVEADPSTTGQAEPEHQGGPLDAQPSSWDSPIWRANEGDSRQEDPMNSRREVRHSAKDRPLEAKKTKDSDEVLRVKGYDGEEEPAE